MDATGCQINNEVGKAVVTKRAKDVHSLPSSDRGVYMSVVAYINADHLMLSSVLIFQGVRENPGLSNGLPTG